jgi:hypothetical protein
MDLGFGDHRAKNSQPHKVLCICKQFEKANRGLGISAATGVTIRVEALFSVLRVVPRALDRAAMCPPSIDVSFSSRQPPDQAAPANGAENGDRQANLALVSRLARTSFRRFWLGAARSRPLPKGGQCSGRRRSH